MEVVVAFEGGDPHKPMVLGSVPNGMHPTPVNLPDDNTRSGIRTQTSPGGGGFKELSFQDATGREQSYFHAKRNLDEITENNRSRIEVVTGNSDERVSGTLVTRAEGRERRTVQGVTHLEYADDVTMTMSRFGRRDPSPRWSATTARSVAG